MNLLGKFRVPVGVEGGGAAGLTATIARNR